MATPSRGLRKDRQIDRMPNDPSPEEIARQCEILQQLWTPAERQFRLGKSINDPKPDLLLRATTREQLGRSDCDPTP